MKLRDICNDKPINFPMYENRFAQVSTDNFFKIPGAPIAYWVNDSVFKVYATSKYKVRNYALGEGKNVTTNNAKYILYHWEVDATKVKGFDGKWLFCAMGGDYRKWYGNKINVIDWSLEARSFYRKTPAGRIIREEYWRMSGITWGKISSGASSFRILGIEQIYQETAVLQHNEEDIVWLLGILNSKVADYYI